jgi:nucleoid-associated protein EbfC
VDLNKMMQQAQKMQEELLKAQEEAKSQIVEGSAGGGAVTVKATGAGRITEIKIDPKAIDPADPESLGDLVLAAVNNALDAAESLMQSKLGGLMGGLEGLGLPGM